MIKTHKKFCATLSYIEHFLILTSAVTRCFSIFFFISLFSIAIGITSSAIGLKVFAVAAGIKNYKSIIKKKKRSMTKLNCQKNLN